MRPQANIRIAGSSSMAELRRLDILGTRTLRTLGCRVGHFLAFLQLFEGDAFHAARMEEKVFRAARVDEPETLVRQRFDCAFGHVCISLIRCLK